MEIKRFSYGRSFPVRNQEVETAPTEDLAVQVTALREELEALRLANEEAVHRARQAGFTEGVAIGREEAGGALLAAVDALHGALEEMDGRLLEQIRTITQDSVEVALSAAELLAGHALALSPVRAVDEALGRVLEQVARGTPIEVHVHPSLVERMEACLKARAGRERRALALSVIPDASIAPSDGLIAWPSGGALVDATARRAALSSELAPFLATSGDADKLSASAEFAAE